MVEYFEHIPSTHRALILAFGISFFWILEGLIPLKNLQYQKWKHARLNFILTASTIVINFLFAKLIILTIDWCQTNSFGILFFLPKNLIIQLVSGLLLLDLISAYFIHWLEHQIKWMWHFHVVHHSDEYVDTTTANRHHPGESVLRAIFTWIAVGLVGAPIWLLMLYQSVSVVLSQFNHANIQIPQKIDKFLSWIIVSPNMHKVHHHWMQPETDSNYGNIFSIWDRIFRTYREMDLGKLRYGIDTKWKVKSGK
jgi:sterol desaturase/sphingolipid hydroxylase (fatty acid hydroxylase superfamily)